MAFNLVSDPQEVYDLSASAEAKFLLESLDEGYADSCMRISGSWTQELVESWHVGQSSQPSSKPSGQWQGANVLQSLKIQQLPYSFTMLLSVPLTIAFLLTVVARFRGGNVANQCHQEAVRQSVLPAE